MALWQEQARKLGGDDLVQVIVDLREGQLQVLKRLEHLENSVAQLNRAFPNGDTEGHRRYHDLKIQELEEKRRLRIAIREKTIAGLVWAVIVGIGTAMWHYTKTKLFN